MVYSIVVVSCTEHFTFFCFLWHVTFISQLTLGVTRKKKCHFWRLYTLCFVCTLCLKSNSYCLCCFPVARLCPTLCNHMDCSMPDFHFPVLHNLPELTQLMSIESVMPSNHPILCHLLLLLPSIFPSVEVCIKFAPPQRWSNPYKQIITILTGLPRWLRWWRICCQCRRHGFNPLIWKIP